MRALLKPVVWVCLFFFAYQSTYAQALKITAGHLVPADFQLFII